jgi:hypothetical protein
VNALKLYERLRARFDADEGAISMNFVPMILGGMGGAAATSFLQQKYGMTAVVASSLVGLLGAAIGSLLSNSHLAAAVFTGSFAGMTAIAVAPLGATALAGAGAGVLLALLTAFNVFPEYGGRLGTVAFISTSLVLRTASVYLKK